MRGENLSAHEVQRAAHKRRVVSGISVYMKDASDRRGDPIRVVTMVAPARFYSFSAAEARTLAKALTDAAEQAEPILTQSEVEHGYPIPDVVLESLPHFTDTSWHNDISSSLRHTVSENGDFDFELWVAEPEKDDREHAEMTRYQACSWPHGYDAGSSDEPAELLQTDSARQAIDWLLERCPVPSE